MRSYRLIDAFSGCGGMTGGFVAAGDDTARIKPVFAVDHDPAGIDSYAANFDPDRQHVFPGPVEELLSGHPDRIPEADITIGGPPCQGFSILNRQRSGDPRRQLWYQFVEIARLSGSRLIVMENVQYLYRSPEWNTITDRLREVGFLHQAGGVLLAADYGVPQKRYRTILIASRIGPVSLPAPTHASPDFLHATRAEERSAALQPWRTVRDAIGNLPIPVGTDIRDDPPPLDLHFGRSPTPISRERYAAIPEGGNRFDLQRNRPDITPACWIRKTSGGTDLMGRLWWDRPSVTIRTEFFKPEKGRYLHPEQNRPITHREGARLQSFPDEFQFCGKKVEIARQIGNAVPPLLAKAIAMQCLRVLQGTDVNRV
ncbi:DNA (cytosine-5-)-methyltransferase [bacterium]|nr:DNA (cytosine-5-)-methyltransferase [bacterium]